MIQPAETARDILADLERQTQFLPGTAPGLAKFRFLGSESFLVWPDYVFGHFEDGHTDGYAMLQYRVEEGGAIVWKELCRTNP